jgi:signal transduction histidine kinase/ligand-binding sensor domain-containing protein
LFRLKIILVFSLLISISGLSAQPRILQSLRKIQSSEKYVVSNWNSNSGLPQNSINRICQDKNGFIWMATYGGLVRFDGTRFKVYSSKNFPELFSDRIVSLFIDSKNNIWLSNELGKIILFDGRQFHDLSSKFNVNFNIANNFNEDSKGNVYVKVDSTLFYYTNGKAEAVQFLIDGKPSSKVRLSETSLNLKNDTLFISQENYLSLVFNGKCVKTVRINKSSKYTYSLLANTNGYWYINDNRLYFSKTFNDIPQAKNLFPNIQFTKVYDSGSMLLAATFDQGIYQINKDFTIERIFTQKQIPTFQRTTLLIDSENNWWVGTELNGVYYIKKKFLYTLNKSFGLDRTNTYPIFQDSKGSIWFGQNRGLLKIENNKLVRADQKYFKSIPVIWSIAEDKDKNIWLGSNGAGLTRIKNNLMDNLTPQVAKETGLNFFSIYKDSQNRMWMGTIGCITKYENGKFSFFMPFNDKKNIYRNIIEDKDTIIWFASDNGLVRFSNNKFTLIDFIDARSARALYIDRKNRLWIGTYGNGLRIKDGNKYYSMRIKDGLFSDIISAIAEDFKGNYWFTCNNGIFRIRESDIEKFLSGENNSVNSINYGNEEGLENIEFNGGCQPSWMRDYDGNLWFPSFSGPVIVDVNSMNDPVFKPAVKIDNLVYKSTSYFPGDKIILPSDYTNISINIAAPSFSSPSNVRFKYRLVGNNDEWVDIGNKREFVFEKLPYGDYEFQILASDGYGNWSTVPASIKFRVESRFTETPYFYILLSLAASSIFVFFLLLRLKLAQKNQLKLELVVEERTSSLKAAKNEAEIAANEDKMLRAKAEEENRQKMEVLRIVSHDLKNPISAIRGFSEILLEDGDLNDDNKSIAGMIVEASDGMVELINQLLNFSRFEGASFRVIKSNILVKNEVDKIVERFRNQASKKEQKIIKDFRIEDCTINADSTLFAQIIENLIGNAIKYSPLGKEIIVKLLEDQEKIFICIKDFGQGFSDKDKEDLYKPFIKLSSIPTAGEMSSGLGLTIVKKFVELNNGSISLESQKGAGSEFTLEFQKS